MKCKLFRAVLLLSVLCSAMIPWVDASETVNAAIRECQATIPRENPWTRRFPAGWWKARHEANLTAPERAECQLAFIGDSITHYWERGGKATWDKEYAPYKALNMGFGADCTEHVLWRLDHGAVDGMKNLKVIVVMIGTNNGGLHRNAPEDTAEGIRAICQRLTKAAPQARVLLLAVFPRGAGSPHNDKVNEIIARFADDKQIFFLDINKAFFNEQGNLTPDVMGRDLLHPTAKGYEIWAEQMRPALKELME